MTMFKMFDRWLQHKAAMDILNLAVALTSDAIFRGDHDDIDLHKNKIVKLANDLADAHVSVCKKLKEIEGRDPTDKEVKALAALSKTVQ